MFGPCSRYVSTVLEVCLDRARGMFRPCSRYVSTVLEVCSTVLEVCFDRARYVWTVLEVCLDRARGMFRPFFDSLGMFRPCSRYVRARGMFRARAQGMFGPCSSVDVSTVLEVCFDRARLCSTVLKVCFDRAGGMFRPCSRYVSTVL